MTLATYDQFKGLEVRDRDGERIGRVDDLGFEVESAQVRYLLIKDGGRIRDRVYMIPVEKFIFQGDSIQLDADKDQLQDAPSYGTPGRPGWDRETEEKIYGHWGIHPYWQSAGYMAHGRTAAELMHRSEEVSLREDTPVDQAAMLMADRNLDRVPIVDHEGHFVGFLTADQVLGVLTPRRPAGAGARPAEPAELEPGRSRGGAHTEEPMAAAQESREPRGEPMPGSAPAPEAVPPEDRERGDGAPPESV